MTLNVCGLLFISQHIFLLAKNISSLVHSPTIEAGYVDMQAAGNFHTIVFFSMTHAPRIRCTGTRLFLITTGVKFG
jgi:hypothetical protein